MRKGLFRFVITFRLCFILISFSVRFALVGDDCIYRIIIGVERIVIRPSVSPFDILCDDDMASVMSLVRLLFSFCDGSIFVFVLFGITSFLSVEIST